MHFYLRIKTMQINVLDAKNRLSELLKMAESGEEVIIARRGTRLCVWCP